MDGRLTAAVWRPHKMRPVLLLSVYLKCGEGLGPVNISILNEASRLIMEFQDLFVMGGDFNIPVQEFKDKKWAESVQ
eukprot:3738258-Karenia_brevis.AAC.1